MPFARGLNIRIINQDGGQPPSYQNTKKSLYLRKSLTNRLEIWHDDAVSPPGLYTVKISKS